MARNLKTNWITIATSGSVVHGKEDGRYIKKEWLTDMAANYNTKVFTACIWPDHRRWFNMGTVLALKVEPATEPELAGEIHLFAILAPNDSLMNANSQGQYTFPSIEVGENYRGTGKYFLKGLGVTDEPGSAGVTELKFSSNSGEEKAIVFSGAQFNVADAVTEHEKESLISRIFNSLKAEPEPSPMPTPTTEKTTEQTDEQKFTAILDAAVKKMGDVVDKKLTDFAKAGKAPGGDDEESEAPTPALKTEPAAPENFTAQFDSLAKKVDDLATKFNTLLGTPGNSTIVPEGDGNGTEARCL